MRSNIMNQINPKGGALIKTSASPQSEEILNKQAKKIIEAYPHMTLKQAQMGLYKEIFAEIYVNNIYQVAVYRNKDADELVHVPELKGRCTWLSIKRKDKRPVNNWQDMQTIKNRLVGANCDAMQLYPSEDRMVNTANQYHLIVLPEGEKIPFGWQQRTVDINNTTNEPDKPTQSFDGEVL